MWFVKTADSAYMESVHALFTHGSRWEATIHHHQSSNLPHTCAHAIAPLNVGVVITSLPLVHPAVSGTHHSCSFLWTRWDECTCAHDWRGCTCCREGTTCKHSQTLQHWPDQHFHGPSLPPAVPSLTLVALMQAEDIWMNRMSRLLWRANKDRYSFFSITTIACMDHASQANQVLSAW